MGHGILFVYGGFLLPMASIRVEKCQGDETFLKRNNGNNEVVVRLRKFHHKKKLHTEKITTSYSSNHTMYDKIG